MAFKFPLTLLSRRDTNRIMDMVALKKAVENGGDGGSVHIVFEEIEVPLSNSAQGGSYLSGTVSVEKEGYKPIALSRCRPLSTGFVLHSFSVDENSMLTVAVCSLTNIMAVNNVLTDGTSITMNGSTASLNKVTVNAISTQVSASATVVYVKNN